MQTEKRKGPALNVVIEVGTLTVGTMRVKRVRSHDAKEEGACVQEMR